MQIGISCPQSKAKQVSFGPHEAKIDLEASVLTHWIEYLL